MSVRELPCPKLVPDIHILIQAFCTKSMVNSTAEAAEQPKRQHFTQFCQVGTSPKILKGDINTTCLPAVVLLMELGKGGGP